MTPISKNCPSNLMQTMVFMSAAIIAGSKYLVRYFPNSTTQGLLVSGGMGSAFAIASQKFAKENESSFERCFCVTAGFAVGAIFVAPLASRFLLNEKSIIRMSGSLRFGTAASVINMIFHWIFPCFKPQEHIEKKLEQHAPVIEPQEEILLEEEESLVEKALVLAKTPAGMIEQGVGYIEERVCQGISSVVSKASQSSYYQSLLDSRPVVAIRTVRDNLLSETNEALVDWAHHKIENLESASYVKRVQDIAQKFEWAFRGVARVDPGKISSVIISHLQTLQDSIEDLDPYLELRKHLKDVVHAAPEKIAELCYGFPERQRNHFGRHFSPIVSKIAAAIKPRDEFLSELHRRRDQMLIVCDSVEKSAIQVFLREALSQEPVGPIINWQVHKWIVPYAVGWGVAYGARYSQQLMGYEMDDETLLTTQKCVSWGLWPLIYSKAPSKLGQTINFQVGKWYLSEAVGWGVAYGVRKVQQMVGYEEDELMAEETLLTTQKCVSWGLWLLIYNVEAWVLDKKLQVHQAKREASKEEPQGTLVNILTTMEQQNGDIGKTAALVKTCLNPHHNKQHTPPPLSIWQRGWNGVKNYWNSWFGQRA